jgi:ribonuclease P protein component
MAADEPRRKRRRLSRSGEFERVYREGRSHASRYLVVYAFPRPEADGDPRLGISVGRKLGGAVERNRVKRMLREAFWAAADELAPGHDFVIVARPDAKGLAEERGGEGMADALREVLAEAGLARGATP